jgi:hypothetical protein
MFGRSASLIAATLLCSATAFAQAADPAAFCTKSGSCQTPPDDAEAIADCATVLTGQIATVATSDATACGPTGTALNALLVCQTAAADCTAFSTEAAAATACVAESEALTSLVRGGTDACFAPTGWNCAGFFFGALDGCDCGCGVADPDCNGAGQSAPGTGFGDATCEYCYDATGAELNGDGLCTDAPPAEGEGEGEGEGEAEPASGCPFNAAGSFPAFGALALLVVGLRRRS